MDSVANDEAPGNGPDELAWREMIPVRVEMTRQLLARSVRNYRAALDFARAVDKAMPAPFRDFENATREPEDERIAWHYLYHQADADFFAAESALSDRIFNLFDLLASEGSRIGGTPIGGEFVERAVSLDGKLYILTFDPNEYEEGKNIIAIVEASRVIRLD